MWKWELLSRVQLMQLMDCSPPGSSVRGILQATILAWVAILFSRGSSQPKDWTWVSCTAGRFLTIWATRACWATVHGVTELDSNERPAAAAAAAAKSLQSCPTLYDPIDGSPPGSSVYGILQARILNWIAVSFSTACMHAKSLQSCPILCDPTDSSPPGSSVHGILQARILECVAISFS